MKSGSWSSFQAAGALGPSEPDDEPTPEQAKPCADGVERVLFCVRVGGSSPVIDTRCADAWYALEACASTEARDLFDVPREPGLHVWEGRTVFRDQSYGDVAREPQWEYHGKVRPATLADFAAFGLAAPGGG